MLLLFNFSVIIYNKEEHTAVTAPQDTMWEISDTPLGNLDVVDCNSRLLGSPVSTGTVSVKSRVASIFRNCTDISWHWVTWQDCTARANMHKQRFWIQGDQIMILHSSMQHFSQLQFLRFQGPRREAQKATAFKDHFCYGISSPITLVQLKYVNSFNCPTWN